MTQVNDVKTLHYNWLRSLVKVHLSLKSASMNLNLSTQSFFHVHPSCHGQHSDEVCVAKTPSCLCFAVNCGSPRDETGTRVNYTTSNSLDTASYQCNADYETETQTPNITCNEELGMWSQSTLHCCGKKCFSWTFCSHTSPHRACWLRQICHKGFSVLARASSPNKAKHE